MKSKGYLVLTARGVRPGGQGGATGKAAEYDIPHRHSTNTPPVPIPSNVRRPEGKLRQHAQRIRHAVARMTETEVTVFTYAVTHRDRSREGALKDPEPFALPLKDLAPRLRLARSTLAGAIAGLVKKNLLIVSEASRGRRPTTYRLPPAWESFRGA
jgi:DNA-binding MarR family transcriptional regulator